MKAVTMGIGVAAALMWMSQMDGKDAVAAIIFMLLGVAITMSVVSLTGGTSSLNAKRNAEREKTLGARERALLAREQALNSEVLRRARPLAEQLFATWVARKEAEWQPDPVLPMPTNTSINFTEEEL